jgi:RNAse (barnase) inhibitor barstar
VQTENSNNDRSLGFQYLFNTCVTMFYRMPVLENAISELSEAGYHVVHADASRWLRVRDMHDDLVRMLHFPGYYGYNLDAFNDCMHDVICRDYGFTPDATGLVLVFTDYQAFAAQFKREAHVLLDIIAGQSRHALIRGEHVFCLIQADDPRFTLPVVGAVPLMWNRAEWLNASRGQ